MIAAWVKSARTEAGLSGAALGAKLALELGTERGNTKANISHWETQKHSPSLHQLIAISKVTGKALPDEILSGMGGASVSRKQSVQPGFTDELSDVEDGPKILATPRLIPVVGRVQAGIDGLLHIDDFGPDHPDGYVMWYSSCTESYVLRIRGESMSPRYLPGEYVGVDPCAEVLPSDEAIILFKDGRRMIKRLLWVRDMQACLESVNKDHPNIIIDCEDVDAMHLVLGHIPKSAFRPNVGH
jgi:SOS-response transcriptional repressor LexA